MKSAAPVLCAFAVLSGVGTIGAQSFGLGQGASGNEAGRTVVAQSQAKAAEAARESALLISSSRTEAGLPDAPHSQPDATVSEAQATGHPTASGASPSSQTPALLAPWMTRVPLTGTEKFSLYAHQAFNPAPVLVPIVPAAFHMISPPNHYPHDWKAGGDGFGRLYGDGVARVESERFAQFATGLVLHEDPRYYPSPNPKPGARVLHALAFTLVDKSDSRHNIPAFSNFAGAAASGFVGIGYLPDGFRDATHAGQRGLTTMAGYAGLNVANEFCPQWAPVVARFHIPFVHPSCPY